MVSLVMGIQFLFILTFGTALFHEVTEAGFFASLIFGGMGACALLGVLSAAFPRITLAMLTLSWATTGYVLGASLFGDIASALAAALLLGGLALAGNIGLMQEVGGSYQQKQHSAAAFEPRANEHILSASEVERILSVWEGLHILHSIGALDRSILVDLEHQFKEALETSAAEAPDPAVLQSPSTDEVMTSLIKVRDADILSDAESDTIGRRVKAWLEEPKPTGLGRPEKAQGIELPGLQIATQEAKLLAASLYRLAENRALSLGTFTRIMTRLDPDYEPSRVRPENFPFLDEADVTDLEVVERLHELDLINRIEFGRAQKVVLPYIRRRRQRPVSAKSA